MGEAERHEVVVVGGGQAGLAVGHYLAQQQRDFTILEAAAAPAASWRARWDSLRLFTPARYSGLPGRPFPGDPDGYPSRDDVVAYLTGYARELELPVELSSPVRALRARDGGYVAELDDRVYEADQVVIATGPFQRAERRDPGTSGSATDSDHPMHHPFHIHGAGRFLILARDGETEPNLMWKDTVLVRTGETVDILLDVTNPGLWMAHCHIAEHHESGMMFSFDVAARDGEDDRGA